jgi:L,D-transpeptidase YcbB
MKNVILLTIILNGLIACENIVGGVRTENANKAKADITPVQRDNSITAANSYSDIFLDSAVVDAYIKEKALTDTLALQLRNFYNERNYQYAWLASDGFTEQGRGFWNIYSNNKAAGSADTANKSLADTTLNRRMDTLLETDSLHVTGSDSNFIKTELALTQRFIQHINNTSDSAAAHLHNFIPIKKTTVRQLTDSILNKKDSGQSLSFTSDSTQKFTANQQYTLLKQALQKYDSIAQKGGWQPISAPGKIIKKGTKAPVVSSIKKRLQLSGDMSGSDTTQVYNDSLEIAVKKFQQQHGQNPDGAISDSLIAIMNIPVEERMKQILVNMNRLVWMPTQQSERLIEVNVPDFMLNIYEGNRKAFNSKVIVGKEGTNSIMFNGNLNEIVFNPYWNIPASIVQNEIMPAMKKDPNYLKRHNMEIVKQNDSVPAIRQLPGPQNALGKVKFLFPNTYEIYLHDSPQKELFEQKNRALSHGCIRVADAQKLAEYLLKNNPGWTPEKVRQAINSGKEQSVALKEPVPVSITYLTAWVDENGEINFRNDIYGHDARTASKMFSA